jgi:hypothetical protein
VLSLATLVLLLIWIGRTTSDRHVDLGGRR